MRYSIISVLAIALLPTALAESCLGGGGSCMTPNRCLKTELGSVSTDLCSGGDNNRCCDLEGNYQCGYKGKGRCKWKSEGCSGKWQTGYCPLGDDFRCCF